MCQLKKTEKYMLLYICPVIYRYFQTDSDHRDQAERYIQPSVNDKCPGFFSDFAGNSRTRKPKKLQTKRANITGVQYFCGIWSRLRAHEQERCQLRLIVYPLFILFLHNLRQLPFLPPPPPEYATPTSTGGHDKY